MSAVFIKQLLKYFNGYKIKALIGPLLKLCEAVLELFIPILMSKIIDVGIPNNDIGYILKMGGLMLLFGALGLVCALTCQYFAALVAYGFGCNLRNGLFGHILSFFGPEINQFGLGTLITRMTNDVTQVQNGVNMFIRLAIRAPFLTIGCIVMAFIINAKIALVFVAALIVLIAIIIFIMRKSIPKYTDIQAQQDVISRLVGENLEGARVIRAFNRQDEQLEEFKQTGDELAFKSVTAGKIAGALNPLSYAVANLAIVAIVWLGAAGVNSSFLQNGDIIALVSYMTQTMLVLMVFANILVLFAKSFASAKRLAEILNTKPQIVQAQNAITQNEKNDICFDNVTFYYNQNAQPALKDISFYLAQGKSLGIIGGTGSGKSTIVNLLTRSFDTTKGTVKIGEVDVKAYSFEALYKKIAVVPQTSVLFKGTIRQNMLFANKNASDSQIMQALKTAQALEIVKNFSEGLDYEISEGGKNLSGGQRQRFAIARAIVAKPEILVLDDSASALDYATDAALRAAIKQDLRNISVVIISQRAATVKNCDLILVLQDGELAASGTHSELMQKNDIYKEICVSQGLAESEEG